MSRLAPFVVIFAAAGLYGSWVLVPSRVEKYPRKTYRAQSEIEFAVSNSTMDSYELQEETPIAPVLTPRLRQLYGSELCSWEADRCKVFGLDDPDQIIRGLSRLSNPDFLKKWTVWNEMENSFLFKHDVIISSAGDVRICSDGETNLLIGSYGCKDIIDSVSECHRAWFEKHDKVIVISQYWGEGYFHAMIEGMPRLMQGMELLGDEAHKWSVHSLMRPAMAEQIVALLGLRGAVFGDARASTVLIPRPTACGGELNGRWVRRIRPRFVVFDLNLTKKMIVCKRGEGSARALTNHQEVVSAVRALWKGEVLEHTGGSSFADQMRLFASSDGVLGPHGAGLSNMVFMRSGSLVIEVLPTLGSNRLNPCYIVLAYTLRHRYFGLHGEFDASGQGSLDVSLLGGLPVW